MHEHLFVVDPEVISNYGQGWWDEDERVADAVRKLTAAKAAGVDTVVDLTVLGIGRDLERVRRVNQGVDINIVAATGVYTFGELPRLFRNRGPQQATVEGDPMVELFVRDIQEGIAETGVKAGMLKCVWETPDLSPDSRRVHAAVSAAHHLTDTPVTVHTNSTSQTGRQVLDFYAGLEVPLDRVVVGHAGDATDLDYLKALMDRGATIGCDRFGLDTYARTGQRVRIVAALCQAGYADRIVLSHDSACFTESWPTAAALAVLGNQLPDWNYTFIPTAVVPALREAGVLEAHLVAMLRDNPQRLLASSSALADRQVVTSHDKPTSNHSAA